jgi:glucose-1-phosphate thymidylyltransferase
MGCSASGTGRSWAADPRGAALRPAAGRLPAYLQQLEMESNGKSVRLAGGASSFATRPWSGASRRRTRSTRFSRCCIRERDAALDFIAPLRGSWGGTEGRIWRCRIASPNPRHSPSATRLEEVEADMRKAGARQPTSPFACAPRLRGQPAEFVADVSANHGAHVGRAHRPVRAQRVRAGHVWGINSFDQFGVELGKKLAQGIDIHGNLAPTGHGAAGLKALIATSTLIERSDLKCCAQMPRSARKAYDNLYWPLNHQRDGILVKKRKGIILAGGAGTRLHPITLSQSKQLLPVYDKPMIYYPLATLMSAGIRDFLIITTPRDQIAFRDLLGSGEKWGISFEYAVQPEPNGIAQALIIAERFLDGAPSALILGDNIFYGANLSELLQSASTRSRAPRCSAITYRIPSATAWCNSMPTEKSWTCWKNPKAPSNYAVTGIYFYDERASQIADPSSLPRGELEITDLNRAYLREGRLQRRAAGPRHRVAGYRHAQFAAGCRRVRAHHRGAAGIEGGVRRGGRLADGIHRRRAQQPRHPLPRAATASTCMRRILRDEHQA